jgi:hypothetical protein
MEKFNLERALAGEPVITRDGKEVTQLVYFKDVINKDCVYGVLGNQITTWCIDGKFFHDDPNEFKADLFMKPKENAIWVNVYSKNSRIWTTEGTDGGFKTEQEAKKDAQGDMYYIKTIRITDKLDQV